MSAPNPRKRAAPSPMFPYPQRSQEQFNGENGVAPSIAPSMLPWSELGADFADNSASTSGLVSTPSQYNQVSPPSTTLARRDPNQALVTSHNRNFDTSVEPWISFGDDNALSQPKSEGGLIEQDNVEALEEMAQKAKREAQSKRKQIPPFVQKLSSFLEERKNEDLIRWSEKGDSFIVLDEDEFAKTLIPELFKHNNYASFVRQLNMYGFHKRVGLSDNSMRASERKNKSPSEYYNPFFRRGRPNLLWLINKPKGKPKTPSRNKNNEGEGDSDEDQMIEDGAAQASVGSNVPTGRSLPAPPDSQAMPKKEMTLIREELHKVREQQKRILGAINQLQHNNNDLYNQAMMFQNQHDRHQNSINAILKFLANVFRKTLEDHGNLQSVSDIVSSMITNQAQQQPQQGSVVDLGDFFQTQMDPTQGGAQKRARGLLPPIPNETEAAQSARSPSTSSTPYHPVGSQNPEMGRVTELADGIDTPPNLRHELENNPHERMMKIINDHNAINKSGLDLPEAADIVANAPNAFGTDPSSDLAEFISGPSLSAARAASLSSSSIQPTTGPSGKATPPSHMADPNVSPPAPDHIEVPSMSPIMRSPQMVPPSLNQINSNQIDLSALQRLQSDQDAKINELSDLLGPLSPSGRIPGLGDGNDSYFDPSHVDLDQYFDSNAFLNDPNFETDGNDFNFGLEADGAENDPLGKQNQVNHTSSSTDTEDFKEEDPEINSDAQVRNKKKRRVA